MIKDDTDFRNDPIAELIEAETQGALSKFLAEDFEAKVRARIPAVPSRKRSVLTPRRRALPAWIAAAALILVGVALLLLPPEKKQGPQMASTIEHLLRQAPGMGGVIDLAAARLQVEEDRFSPAESAIVSALLAGRQSAAAPRKSAPKTKSSDEAKRPRPLGLEEMYKILFIDKSVERVLTLISS